MEQVIEIEASSPSEKKTRTSLQNVFIAVTCVYKKDTLEDQEVEGEIQEVISAYDYLTGQSNFQFDLGQFDGVDTFSIQELIDIAASRAIKQI